MILHGCPLNSGAVPMPYTACNPKSYKSGSLSVPRSAVDVVISSAGSSWAPHRNRISCSKGVSMFSELIYHSALSHTGIYVYYYDPILFVVPIKPIWLLFLVLLAV